MFEIAQINPYYNQTLFSFFWTLLGRLLTWFKGGLSMTELATDEVQMIVLVGVAASSALVGTFLILRRMTMLANSLSHTILLGIVIAFAVLHAGGEEEAHGSYQMINLQTMLVAAFLTGIVTTFLTEFLTKVVNLQEDASTGIVFTSLFAVGIILVTILSRNAHIGTEVVMGNVDALHVDDCQLVAWILLLNIVVLSLFFKEFQITTFDPSLANSIGISTNIYNYLLMILVSTTVIGAFRAVGVLMVLSFITAPPLTARLLTHDLKTMLGLAVAIGSASSILGVAISRHILTTTGMALSTGGVVVCVLVMVFVAAALFSSQRSKFLISKALKFRPK